MKVLLALWLFCLPIVGAAVECGPFTQTSEIEAYQQQIARIQKNLRAHRVSVLKEVNTTVDRMQAQPTRDAVKRVIDLQMVQFRITQVEVIALDIARVLVVPDAVAGIRDHMIDERDRATANSALSTTLEYLSEESRRSHESIGRLFPKISPPAAVHDVAELRDKIGEIAAKYQRCTSPLPSRPGFFSK